MPDSRRHRGPHPGDAELFGPAAVAVLVDAVTDLTWLLGRGYSIGAATTLVGDRYQLHKRQRLAVRRSACADGDAAGRIARHTAVQRLEGSTLHIDGFNCIVTVEAALSGGLLLVGNDGAHRDLSSVHGNYRRVAETETAIAAIASVLRHHTPARTIWYLDRPVSNSGRLAGMLRAENADWEVQLEFNPDRAIVNAVHTALVGQASPVVATSDSWILQNCDSWIDLPAAALVHCAPDAWRIDLSATRPRSAPAR